MPFIPSLTGLACLAGLTLLIRMLRRAQKEDVDSESGNQRVNQQGKLSKNALYMLIETDPLPYWIVDVRHPGIVRRNPAPEVLTKGPGPYVHVAVDDISKVLYRRGSGEFSRRFPELRFPDKDDVLVFVSDKVEQSKQGVKEAQTLGFTRSVYFDASISFMAEPPKQRPDAQLLSKHAVAVLLKMVDNFSPVEATVIDLRRTDEHIAFGSIEGMKNIPAAELPRALTMENTEYMEKYQFPKPSADDILVFSCRTMRRAKWAALLCNEAGFKRVYVHGTGSFGWEFSSNVKKYESYDKGDPFPKPIKFKVDRPDRNAGLRELSDAGLTSSLRQDVSPESGRVRTGST